MNKTSPITVDLMPVFKIYEEIIGIEEYYTKVNRWSHILPNGDDIRQSTYAGTNLKETIKMLHSIGCIIVNFKCVSKNKKQLEVVYPDYKISELIK